MSKVKSEILDNKKMNQDTYEMRSEVMDIIYEIKNEIVDIPRVEVRITNSDEKYFGVAKRGANEIFITDTAVKSDYLRQVVYHEVLHAVYGTYHNENCALMQSQENEVLTKEKCQELFKKYI